MDYHNWIYRTRWLMAEVETAMKRLTQYMEKYGTLPNLFCTGESEAGTIMRKSGELRQKLRGVYYGIADNWQRIIENKVLRDEVAKHLVGYTELKDASRKLRLALKDSPETERNLFGDSQIVDRLEDFFDELDDDMYYILIEMSDMPAHRKEQYPDLNGLAYRMRKFLPDADENFFLKLIKERSLPPEPVIWHGQKADCARFLQHFGFTDKQANRIFCCVKDGRRLKRLKISSDIGRKGDDSYPVMAILKDYPYNPD